MHQASETRSPLELREVEARTVVDNRDQETIFRRFKVGQGIKDALSSITPLSDRATVIPQLQTSEFFSKQLLRHLALPLTIDTWRMLVLATDKPEVVKQMEQLLEQKRTEVKLKQPSPDGQKEVETLGSHLVAVAQAYPKPAVSALDKIYRMPTGDRSSSTSSIRLLLLYKCIQELRSDRDGHARLARTRRVGLTLSSEILPAVQRMRRQVKRFAVRRQRLCLLLSQFLDCQALQTFFILP
jgi:hypothetical protein